MSYEQFRRGLGLLGREDTFICRIFNLIDEDGDGKITEENYLNYLNIILKGTDLEKARFGWLILTENKGDMDLKDFMELFQQISIVWNTLTGEIVMPKRKYVQELFNTFDVDQDQSITFHEYFNSYTVIVYFSMSVCSFRGGLSILMDWTMTSRYLGCSCKN